MLNLERRQVCEFATILVLSTIMPMGFGCGKGGSPVNVFFADESRNTSKRKSNEYEPGNEYEHGRENENEYGRYDESDYENDHGYEYENEKIHGNDHGGEKERHERNHGNGIHREENFEFQQLLLQDLADEIHAVDERYYARGEHKKDSLIKAVSEVQLDLQSKNPNIKSIINKLESQVLKKTDGCGGSVSGTADANDVIKSCEFQAVAYEKCLTVMQSITCGHLDYMEIFAIDQSTVYMTEIGENVAFYAMAYYADSTCERIDVTKYAEWTSSVPSIADFSMNGWELTAATDGDTIVTASVFNNDSANEIPVNVTTCDEAVFADPGVELAVRTSVGYTGPDAGRICMEHVSGIVRINLDGKVTTGNLSGIENLKNLWQLYIRNNDISDISPLAALENLSYLYMDNNRVSDLTPLSGLSRLTILRIIKNGLTDLSPLGNISNLVILMLNGNNISDISALASHTKMLQLILTSNYISDISPLADMRRLEEVRLDNNNISDLSPLAGISTLKTVVFSNNNVSDLSPVAGLTSINILHVSYNPIKSLTPVAGLITLVRFAAEGNQITDISFLIGMFNLEYAMLKNNLIENVLPLEHMPNICYVDLTNNKVSSIAELAANIGVGSGDDVLIRGNPLNSESINVHIPEIVSRGANVWY